jgi:hypothetical protein
VEKDKAPPPWRRNHLALAGLLTGNLAVFALVARGNALLLGFAEHWTEVLRVLVPAGAAGLIASLLNSQLSADAKAHIVFMRRNPLPGMRAFSHFAQCDPRIDFAALARRFGPFPSAPREQNALWYRLFRSVEDTPRVREAHEQYLLWRDCTALVLLLAAVLLPLAAVLSQNAVIVGALLLLFAAEFLLASQAARVNGERFVCDVLALKSSEAEPAA